MNLLAIDCSTPQLSVALTRNQAFPLQQQAEHHPPQPNPVLSLVDRLLSEAGQTLGQVDGFALTLGPGSFTGLRVGLSLVKGFLLALEKPVVGIGSLEAWAYRLSTEESVCSVLDARKGEVYYARFGGGASGWKALGEEQVGTPQAVVSAITGPTVFIGTALARYGTQWKQVLGDRFREALPQPELTVAGAAALLAAQRFDTHSCYDPDRLSLRYLRRPEAEVHWNHG